MPTIPFLPIGPGAVTSRYPENLGQRPVDKWMLFEARTGRHVVRNVIPEAGGTSDRTIASVGLYLPESALKDTLSVTYEQNDLGPFVGGLVEYLAQGGQNLFNIKPGQLSADRNGINGLLEAVKGMRDSASTADITPGKLADAFGELLKADAFRGIDNLTGGAGRAVLGQAPNPRTDLFFSTQQYRIHEYQFLLVPRTLAEAKAIDQIVHFFQFYMLPSYRAGELETSLKVGSFMMGFPYEFVISFRDEIGRKLSHVNSPARSVLTSVSIDHAGAGKTAFIKHGQEFYPVATKLGLSFQEVVLLGRDSRNELDRPGADESIHPDPKA